MTHTLNMPNILVCGSRMSCKRAEAYESYRRLVFGKLTELYVNQLAIHACLKPEFPFEFVIIEGCCPDSADQFAEEWYELNKVKLEGLSIRHFPSTSGNYLKRNIEMVEEADFVVGFWDNYSYGTCHCLAHAVKSDKKVIVYDVKTF